MSMLRARGVTKRFWKKRVLRGVDLELAPGEVTVLLGCNGAGKSTLMRLALGVLKPTSGTLEVFGKDPTREARYCRERIGYVPDIPDAWDWMTPLRFWKFLRPQYPTWNDELCARLAGELAFPTDAPFSTLSRGEGMKAMLVAALAPEPELLLLDEPFGGLDPMTREELLRGVISELRDGRRTVLLSTHELDLAARVADRVAILKGGVVAEHGSLDEVLGEDEGRLPERLYSALQAAEA